MDKLRLKERPDLILGLVSIVVTFILGVLAIIVSLYYPEVRKYIDNIQGKLAWSLFIVVLVASAVLVLNLRVKVQQLKAQIAGLKGPRTQTTARFGRWEEIRQVTYGHVEYFPFLYYRHPHLMPVGIGVRVLQELFRGNGILLQFPMKSSWGDMLDGLIRKDFDIIATPLFETNERSARVAFSAPMFFADVGLYTRKDYLKCVRPNSLGFDKAIEQLHVSYGEQLRVEVISGELSEKMAKKHLELSQQQQTVLLSQQASIQNLISGLVDHNRHADVVFAERFVAELTTEVETAEVINILRPCELLYPVGFAMRREDYILRNYINIRLMELDDTKPDRIFGFIVEELKAHPGFSSIDLKTAQRYFVRKKPW